MEEFRGPGDESAGRIEELLDSEEIRAALLDALTSDCPSPSRIAFALLGIRPWEEEELKHQENCACGKIIERFQGELKRWLAAGEEIMKRVDESLEEEAHEEGEYGVEAGVAEEIPGRMELEYDLQEILERGLELAGASAPVRGEEPVGGAAPAAASAGADKEGGERKGKRRCRDENLARFGYDENFLLCVEEKGEACHIALYLKKRREGPPGPLQVKVACQGGVRRVPVSANGTARFCIRGKGAGKIGISFEAP